MGILLHKLPRFHKEIFGDDNPRSLYFIMMKTLDRFNMHPIRPEFTPMLRISSDEQKQAFKDKFVEEVPIEGLEDIAPAFHFEKGVHRSWRLIEMLAKDKHIKEPLAIFYGKGLKDNHWKNGYIYEGKHRAGAAKLLGWETVPAFSLHTVGTGDGYCNMTYDERAEMKKEQEKRGLPDTSRICGVRINLWSERELRQFMYPRPKDPNQYYVQDLDTTKCGLGHPAWEGIPKGSVEIKLREGNFKLPWEIDDAKI